MLKTAEQLGFTPASRSRVQIEETPVIDGTCLSCRIRRNKNTVLDQSSGTKKLIIGAAAHVHNATSSADLRTNGRSGKSASHFCLPSTCGANVRVWSPRTRCQGRVGQDAGTQEFNAESHDSHT